METEPVTEATALQLPTQSEERHGNLIILGKNPIYVEVENIPPNTPESCKTSAGSHGCWDVNVAILLVILAGVLILALFYHVLLLRHKLRVAQAGNALEYFGFYHVAQYNLKALPRAPDLPTVTPHVPEASPSCPPSLDVLPVVPPLLPPPPPPSLRSSLVPLPQPTIYTTPPSPQSDAEVYSRIGALRLSRLSSVSQTQVVLFEHSSL